MSSSIGQEGLLYKVKISFSMPYLFQIFSDKIKALEIGYKLNKPY